MTAPNQQPAGLVGAPPGSPRYEVPESCPVNVEVAGEGVAILHFPEGAECPGDHRLATIWTKRLDDLATCSPCDEVVHAA